MASNTIEMAEAAQGLSSAEAAARLVQYVAPTSSSRDARRCCGSSWRAFAIRWC